jgi:hypothetical protein
VRRSRLALLLVLTFLVALFAPVRVGWACPDGSPCVAEGRTYICAGKQCSVRASCCRVDRPNYCKHGAIPGGGGQRSDRPEIQAADRCHFSVSSWTRPVAGSTQRPVLLWLSFDVLPAPAAVELSAPDLTPVWLSVDTLGYRPPPSLLSGPSRAPPIA